MSRLGAIAVALALTFASSAAAEWKAAELKTRTLADQDLSIPADLPERSSLLVIGFTRESRVQTSAWSSELARDRTLNDLMATYQIVVLEDVPALMRRFVIRGIHNGVPESLHDRFLVVTDRSEDWKELASFSQSDTAYLVLLDKHRRIRWQGAGEPSATSLQALRIAAEESREIP